MYEVIDNLLGEEEYGVLQAVVTDDKGFPWFYGPEQVDDKDDGHYLYHVLYSNNRPNSQWFDFVQPVLDKIKCQSLITCRANMVLHPSPKGSSALHRDTYSEDLSHKTAIFYIGETNGKTILQGSEGDIEIDHKPNRILIFDADTWHKSQHQTDTNRRIVINFNYF